jgi:DNA-binding transcriptional LysR family regulator
MNLRQLTYFCEVVEAGSMAQAAQRLFVAPTAITMQIAQLEAELGGVLFDRNRRPMQLTALGKFLFPRAKDLLRQHLRLEEETRGMAAGRRGSIAIGFARSTIYSLIPMAVRSFRQSFPEVQIDLLETPSADQPEQLRSGRIQVGISRFIGPFDRPMDLRYTLLLEDPFVAALPSNHPLAARASLEMAELGATTFISFPKNPNGIFFRELLAMVQRTGTTPHIGYEAIEIETALALVAAGLGFTLVGASVANNNRTDVAFVPVTDLQGRSEVLAVTRADQDGRLVEAFLEQLRP